MPSSLRRFYRPACGFLTFWSSKQRTSKIACGYWKGRPGKSTVAAIRRILAQAGPVWAFPGRKEGAHKTRQAVWEDVKRAAAAFRLPQNVGTHSFRKVYAVDLLDKYGDLPRVQRAMGHSSPSVTAIYAMADRLMEARHPGHVKSHLT